MSLLSDDNLLSLDDLSEDQLVSSLRERFERRKRVYTSVGTILIAINPYEWQTELYTKEVMRRYGKPGAKLPPHLYQTAQLVHEALVAAEGATRQTVIISGESGAGKTESTKLILTYLVEAASEPTHARLALRERVLRANPLLEAFGNATTLRNDNSSRFGKLVELHFSRPAGQTKGSGEISGAKIVNYLLERTRLSRPPDGERNFHILYQLLSPSFARPEGVRIDERTDELLAALPIGSPEQLYYLNAHDSPWSAEEASDEARAFASTTATLDALGVHGKEREQLWGLLAAVLLLGNLEFTPINTTSTTASMRSPTSANGSSGVMPSDPAAIATLSSLLGVSADALSAALCKRKLSVKLQSTIHRNATESQAKDARDALARALYNGCFEWLVHKINCTIQPPPTPITHAMSPPPAAAAEGWPGLASTRTVTSPPKQTQPSNDMITSIVGVLDIYGFERLEVNSFEQLLINYANEKLQRLFNLHIFELEQAEYKREGIEWREVSWRDNQTTLELIEGRPNNAPGILYALDDATWRASEDGVADTNFINGLHAAFGATPSTLSATVSHSHPSYVKPRLNSSSEFSVLHYAGEVTYDVNGFARKNTETLTPDAHELLQSSTNPWLMKNKHFVNPLAPPVADTKENTQNINSPLALIKETKQGGGRKIEARKPSFQRGGSRIRQASVGEQFRSQLHDLISVIDPIAAERSSSSNTAATAGSNVGGAGSGGCAYVRCIKSNEYKEAWSLDVEGLTHQLRCAGMMEAVRIRRESFATRYTHTTFLQSFRAILPSDVPPATAALTEHLNGAKKAARSLTARLAKALHEPEASSWQCGHTKIFVRQPFASRLLKWRDVRRAAAYRSIESAVKSRIRRVRNSAATTIQHGWIVRQKVLKGRAVRLLAKVREGGFARWRAYSTQVRKVLEMRAAAKADADAAAAAVAAAKAATTEATPMVSPPKFVGPGAAIQAFAPPTTSSALSTPVRAAPATPSITVSLSELPAGDLQRVVQAKLTEPHPPPAATASTGMPTPQQAASSRSKLGSSSVKKNVRTIEQLGPKHALCMCGDVTVSYAASRMLESRSEAVLIVEGSSSSSEVSSSPTSSKVIGILTATDIARRVVAMGKDPTTCKAADVMTSNPHTVQSTDAADDALSVMISGSFRHVPVLSEGGTGAPPRLLDLVRCLYDVILMLERAQAAGEALIDAVTRQSGGAGGEAVGAALSTLLAPSLNSLAAICEPPRVVNHGANLQEAAIAMRAPGVTAVLVRSSTNDGGYELLTPRALLTAVANGCQDGQTVGTYSDGETLPLLPPSECTVLDALHLLQGEKRTHALLLSSASSLGEIFEGADSSCAVPIALLDMLQLVRASIAHAERSADAQQLNAFMGATAALSEVGGNGGSDHQRRPPTRIIHAPRGMISSLPEDEVRDAFGEETGSPSYAFGSPDGRRSSGSMVSELYDFGAGRTDIGSIAGASAIYQDIGDSVSQIGMSASIRPDDSISSVGVNPPAGALAYAPGAPSSSRLGAGPLSQVGMSDGPLPWGASANAPGGTTGLLLKLKDARGNMHRVRCEPADGWNALRSTVSTKVQEPSLQSLLYADDDGDQVAIDSDEALLDAAMQAKRNDGRLQVTAVTADGKQLPGPDKPSNNSKGGGNTLTNQAAKAAARVAAAAAAREGDSTAVSSFLGGLIAASSFAVGAGLVLAAKAAQR